eukprot:scaffold56706_cov54-Attheya_sp.AAC.3
MVLVPTNHKVAFSPPGFFATVDDILADRSKRRMMEEEEEGGPTEEKEGVKGEGSVLAHPPVSLDAGCDVMWGRILLDAIAIATHAAYSSQKKSSTVPNGHGCRGSRGHSLLCGLSVSTMAQTWQNKKWNPTAQRITWMKEADPHIFFVLGLGPAYLPSPSHNKQNNDDDDDCEDDQEEEEDDMEEAVDDLMDAIESDDCVVGVHAKLDYSPELLERPSHDRASQLRRFRATCTAAMESNVPIQCRVVSPPDPDPQ